MRIVTTPDFCSPCKEGLWLSLFTSISHLEGFAGECHEADDSIDEPYMTIDMTLLPMGQFRVGDGNPPEGEFYSIAWTRNEVPWPEFANMTGVIVRDSESSETETLFITMDIELHTKEVRSDPDGLLKAGFYFATQGKCAPKEISKTVEVTEFM